MKPSIWRYSPIELEPHKSLLLSKAPSARVAHGPERVKRGLLDVAQKKVLGAFGSETLNILPFAPLTQVTPIFLEEMAMGIP